MKFFAIILAGGAGTRLWPRSRQGHPKQFLDLVSDRTMLQETCDRIAPLVPPENVFVITNREYVQDVQAQLPGLPGSQIIGEPEGRGTAPAAALAALLLPPGDAQAVIFVLPADHVIPDAETFRLALVAAAQVAQKGYLVTLGIKPQYAETGYGYIEAGDALTEYDGLKASRVRRFREKPNLETAQQFLARGNYFWNSGIFIWRADAILDEFAKYLPKMRAQLEKIAQSGLDAASFTQNWNALENQTLDYGILEKAENVAVISLDAGWSDVGSWTALYDLMQQDSEKNVVHGEHIAVDTHASLIFGDTRLIATIGMENMIVVDTPDALLICPQDRAQDVKKIVDELKRRQANRYL
jgi:mannose-1-phosphate guanylyltransferase